MTDLVDIQTVLFDSLADVCDLTAGSVHTLGNARLVARHTPSVSRRHGPLAELYLNEDLVDDRYAPSSVGRWEG